MYALCVLFTVVILLALGVVLGYLVSIGWRSVTMSFFTQGQVPAGAEGFPGGLANGLAGTAILIGLASVVGIPLGMLCGVYLAEYGENSFLAAPVRFICDVLAGVPSIVVGILGYELLVAPWSYWDGHLHLLGMDWGLLPNGNYNGYAGAAALAFIMIPIVARTTEEMLLLVPRSYREASVALGATKAATILRVVIPAATGGLVTGVMLAIARVAGETAPLLFTALGSRFLETNPAQPFPSLTVQIYKYALSPFKEQNQLAWAGILVLISLIFVANLSIRWFVRRQQAG